MKHLILKSMEDFVLRGAYSGYTGNPVLALWRQFRFGLYRKYLVIAHPTEYTWRGDAKFPPIKGKPVFEDED